MKDAGYKPFIIAFNTFLLVALACWLWYFFPWFGYMEQGSFFCYLPSYILPFLTQPGGGAELMARFLAQFFISPIGVVAVHLVLVFLLSFAIRGVFRVLKCRSVWFGIIAGLAFVPYWVFAFKGLAGFTVAVAYVVNIAVAWGCLSLFQFGKRIGLVFSLVITMCMFYFTGPLALFVLLPVCIRFPVCGWSIIPIWFFTAFLVARCFVYSFSQTSGFDFWQSCGIWQKTALLATIIAWIAGIFLCRTKHKIRCIAYRYFILLPVWSVLWLIPVWYEANPLERTFYLSERYARQERWQDVIVTASDYFDRNPLPQTSLDHNALCWRDMMAVNLKLALLKTGRLNNRFFSYGDIEEMNTYMAGFPVAGHYNFPSVRFASQAGLWVPLRIFANNILNVNGIQNATLQVIIPNSIFGRRYELARNYLYYQNHTLFYRKEARYWQAFADEESSDRQAGIYRRRHSDSHRMWEEEGLALDAWVQALYTPASDSTVLEYFTFTQLFYKKPDSLPALAAHYRRLGYHTIPQYLQEALLIMQHYEPSASVQPQTYSGYAYSPAVVRKYVQAEADRMLYQEGALTFEELQSRYGSTYWFHYYFRRFY